MNSFLTLFKEYFYNTIPSVLFGVLVFASFIVFIKACRMRYPANKGEKMVTLFLFAVAMIVLFTICRRPNIRGIRILHYWIDMGTRHDKMEMYPHGIIADGLIFMVYGFLVRWQRRHIYVSSMCLAIVGLGAFIEVLQFITTHGCIALSDFVAYTVGGFVGIALCQLIGPFMKSFKVK